VSYQKKVKSQSESDEKSKLILTSQKLEIDSHREKQRGLRDKLDTLQAQITSFQEKQGAKKPIEQVLANP
jgi:hypothetical protein